MIYLDHNATTPLSESVKECIKNNLDYFQNPSSLYKESKSVKMRINVARQNVAELINCEPNNIIFTGCATESNNTVLNSCFFKVLPDPKPKHLIVSSVEHPAVLETVKYYEKYYNVSVTCLPVDSKGRIDVNDVFNAVCDNTVLVSIMLVNNELGNCYQVEEISRTVHRINPEILVHTDATQAIGKMKVDVKKLDVDFLTLSGHKFYAPKGIGGLYVKDPLTLSPFFHGGHQEQGLRAGTENYLSIVAMGQAAEEAAKYTDYDRIRTLRDAFEEKVIRYIRGSTVLGDTDNRICNTSCLLFENYNGIDICEYVNRIAGICISSGSACSSKDLSLSHVMKAIGVRKIPIRVSLGRNTTQEDMDNLFKALMKATNILKSKEKTK